MMFQTSSTSRELGHKTTLQSHVIIHSPPCKPQTLFLGFNNTFHFQQTSFNSTIKVSSLHSFIQTHVFNPNINAHNHVFSVSQGLKPTKNWKNGKNRKYGGVLPSILRSLDNETQIEKTLDLYCKSLNPKEQTVILKEQRNWERVVRVFDWFKSRDDYVCNVIHYNVVLRALGRAQRWDELRLFWVEMAENGVLPTNNTYGMLVDVYGKGGLVKESLLWIKHMKLRGFFPDEVTMNTVVRVLKDAGEYDRADRFFKDWCDGKIEIDELNLERLEDSRSLKPVSFKHFLSTELFKTGFRDPSVKILSPSDLDFCTRKPQMTATYNTLIDLYGKAGRLKDAAEIFAEMLNSGVAMDTTTFNTMIYTCGSHGQLSEAEILLTKMEEKGIFPDTKTYNIFISLYADVGNLDAALKCYGKIRELGLFPDVVTHRTILHLLCKRNMVREVEVVIKEMEKSKVRIDEQSLPLLIKMYVNEGSLDKAKVIYEKGLSNGLLSLKNYEAIIDVYAEKGLWAEAEVVFYREGERNNVTGYNVMIKAYGMAKMYDKALSLFMGMKNKGIWPDQCTYNSIIQMLSGGGIAVDQARDILSEMQGLGYKPSCQTFSSIITSYARSNRISDSIDVYNQMVKIGVGPNEVVYGSIIDGFAEDGRILEALHYFRLMEKNGFNANQVVLTSLIKAYSKNNSLNGAKEIYETIKGFEEGPDIVASNSMISMYADFGMVSDAKSIFDDLKDKGIADAVTYATMMYLYKNMGMPDEAIDVAYEMENLDLLNDCVSFNKVMACYATNGNLIECARLLNKMKTRDIIPNKGTYKVLFTVLKKGNFAIEAVKQLESCYREDKNYSREAVFTCVFLVVGLRDFAIEYLNHFLKPGVVLDIFAYNVAIYAYGALGEVEKALNIFMKMQDEGLKPDFVTYINLVGCYGKSGMVEGVKRVYRLLKFGEIEPNESLYKAVIDAYISANRKDLAELVSVEMKYEFNSPQLSPDSEPENDAGDTSSSDEDTYL